MVNKYLEEIIEMLAKLKSAYESGEDSIVCLENTDIRNICIALEYVLKDDEFMNHVQKRNCITEAAYIVHRANENEVGFARISADLLENLIHILNENESSFVRINVDLLETLVDTASSVVEKKQK